MLGFGLREGKVVCRMGRRRGSCSRGGGPEGDRVWTRVAGDGLAHSYGAALGSGSEERRRGIRLADYIVVETMLQSSCLHVSNDKLFLSYLVSPVLTVRQWNDQQLQSDRHVFRLALINQVDY
jgi:hypothetical protein